MLPDSILVPVGISLKTAVTATAITFCLGVLAAWRMSHYRGKAKGLIETIFTAPLVLPPTVVGFLLLLVLGKNSFLGQFLDSIGIRVVFSWYATVIAATVVAFPLMYKSALAAFLQGDRNLVDCARTLGASETTIFWRIILPLAKPGLVAGILLSFARALGEFGATLILAGSIPGQTQTIPIAIFFAAESGAMDRALKLVIVLLIITFCITWGINYWLPTKETKRKSVAKGSKTSSNYQNLAEVHLKVDIQKQLPNFLLDVAFEIDSRQTPLGILGASGAGKTTLIRCIAGLETPDRGIIVLNGRVLFDSAKGINLPPQEREVGLLFQNYALFPHLTVAQNIAFGMPRERSALTVKQELVRHLESIGLTTMGDRFPDRLSGGERQRVALTRALASEPQITLLDEPFSALNADLKTNLLQLLRQRLSGYSGLTLYITHNLAEAYYLCPQLLVMETGKAVAFGSKQQLYQHPPNLPTARMMGCVNFSPIKIISPQTIFALDWQCQLQIEPPLTNTNPRQALVGIYAGAIAFFPAQEKNVFPVWLATFDEFPDRVTLYLKLNSFPESSQDYQLQTSVAFNLWQKLQQLAFPWYVELPASKIMLLNPSVDPSYR